MEWSARLLARGILRATDGLPVAEVIAGLASEEVGAGETYKEYDG
jgi:hypothetical protein